MLSQEQIKKKLQTVKEQKELLVLSNHRALGDYVIVIPAEITEGGITTRASQFEDRPDVGILASVGDDVEGMVEGDVVFFGQYSHVKVTNEDMTYLIMRSEDIYCVAN